MNEEKQNKTKSENQRKIEKMTRLIEENTTLNEKIAEIDQLRKKLSEKNQTYEK